VIELFKHQIRAFNKIINNDKNFIFWPRQYGKSHLISAYLEHFINNNSNQNILFICYEKNYIKYSKQKLLNDIGYLTVDKHRTDDLYFINDNFLKFCSIKQHFDTISGMFKTLSPSLIIFNEVYALSTNNIQRLYSNNFLNGKILYTSSFIDIQLIKMLDYNNDFYINIEQPVDKIDTFGLFKDDINLIYFDIKELNYKPDDLLYFSDKVYQRKIKLKKINTISNGI